LIKLYEEEVEKLEMENRTLDEQVGAKRRELDMMELELE
jgi:hypothetical protein